MWFRSNSTWHPTSLSTKVGEMDLNHVVENSHRCLQNSILDKTMSGTNTTNLRKIFSEVTPSGKEETITEEVDELRWLGTDSAVAGLGYVKSQEPGDLSQASAFDTVNKLLSDNEVGSPQEIDDGKTKVAMLTPLLSAKGARFLARRADHINSFVRAGIFHWSVGLEDEENGNYFSKRKGLNPGSRGDTHHTPGSTSQFKEPRYLSSVAITSAVDKNSEKEGNLKFSPKVKGLACSDSMLTPGNSLQIERIHISEAETKNLFKEMDEQSNSKSLEQQLETTDVGGIEIMFNVGPDTQMAAEAMEALVHGSPINHELRGDKHHVAVNLIEDSSRDMAMIKTLPKNVSMRKKISTSHDPVMLSQRRKVLHSKVIRVSPGPSNEKMESSRVKRKGRNKRLDKRFTSGRKLISHSELQVVDEQHEEELKTSSVIKDVFSHPKRKRTRHITRGVANSNLNKPSISGDDVLGTVMQPHIRKRRIEADAKSLPEIRDTPKRKKRTVSAQFPSENGDVQFNTREMSAVSGASTRLPSSPTSFKPYLEKGSKILSTKPFFCEAVTNDSSSYCATAVMNHRMALQEVALPNHAAEFFSHAEDTKAIAKLEGSPTEKAQSSGLVCATKFKKIKTKPPNCRAHCPPTTSCNKSLLKPSNTRGLIRLEATESASSRPLREMRRRKNFANVRVLFSNNLDGDILKQQKKILARLGVLIAPSISDATHFITNKFARTRNMLEAIAMGKPVVTHMWLESCGQASCFVDEKKYILRDLNKEKKIGFSMPVSLARACQYPLLQARRVFITPNIKPDRELVASLVKAVHGQPIDRIGRFATKISKVPDDLLVISCEEDYSVCTPLLEKGVEIFSSELLLNGIVIQKLEFERHRLFFRSC